MASSNFINDCISDTDYLGYLPYIEAFEYLISNHRFLMNLPVVFGIHGKWGVGKSTFMSLVNKKLNKKDFYTIELNPWEYGNERNFVSTFLVKLYKVIENDLCNEEKKQEDIITKLFKSILKPLKVSADFKLAKVEYDFSKLNFSNQKQIIDDFITENYAMKETIERILEADIFETKKIIVFIDDLDRCPPEKVIEVIESIKLILNSEKCVFFLGCDKEYLENALSIKYEKFIEFLENGEFETNSNSKKTRYAKSLKNFSREYLEKIIQIPFNIPPLDESCMREFVDRILNPTEKVKIKNLENNNDHYKEFKKGLRQELITELVIESNINARRIKRILNLIFLNYIFIKFKFKNNDNTTKVICLDILSFLGFIRDVEQEYYKAFLSSKVICKRVFRDQFSLYKKNLKNNYEDDDEFKQKNNYLQDTSINDYFKVFFEKAIIKTEESLNKKLENIDIYINVSNTTTSEDYKENNWGSVGEIKSEITNKKVSLFLNRLNGHEVFQDIIIWFFENVFDEKIHIIGIQRNIHVYKKTLNSNLDLDNNFLVRFEYSEKENKLLLRFERGNNLSSILLEKNEGLMNFKNYDKSRKQIILGDNSTYDNINEIKDMLKRLISIKNYNDL